MLGVRSLSVLNAQGDVLASNQRALLGKNSQPARVFHPGRGGPFSANIGGECAV